MGFANEKDHPEVGPSQFEMKFSYSEAVVAADQFQLYKLLCRQVASKLGMTASFLPKPVVGINGSGAHTNLSVGRKGKNLFYDKKGQDGLSTFAWSFINRILANANDICLILNSSVNSYRRLDPHFEAPNQIKVSAIDRGAMVRIPLGNEKTARVEVRWRGSRPVCPLRWRAGPSTARRMPPSRRSATGGAAQRLACFAPRQRSRKTAAHTCVMPPFACKHACRLARATAAGALPAPRRRHRLQAAAAACLAAPVAAQELTRPADWKVGFDDPTASEAELEMFVSMPPGWHITTGPSGIFWDPALRAQGKFLAEMEAFLFDPQGRREGFGLFVGGSDLEGPGRTYTYFLVRDGGQFLIKRRAGDDTSELTGWTSHNAILSYADRGDDASVRNVLAVEAGQDRVRFLVNGREVASLSRSDLRVDGTVGLRVNHGLNLHVSRLEVKPLG